MTTSIRAGSTDGALQYNGVDTVKFDATGMTPSAPMHLAAVTPMFSAYQSVSQTVSASVWTKINFQIKEFDTTNAFDNVTNMRYTPQVAGYYQVSTGYIVGTSATAVYLTIYKNGAPFKYLSYNSPSASSTFGSAIVYLNGTTDYIESVCYVSTTQTLSGSMSTTYFQAALIARV